MKGMFTSHAFSGVSTVGGDLELGLMDHEVSDSGGRVWKHTRLAIMFIVPMVMLMLITFYGYKLATTRYTEADSSEGGCIVLLFGIITVTFGLIYFIVGLTIVAEQALDLHAWLWQEDTGTSENEGKEQITSCQIMISTLGIMASMSMLTWAIYYGYKLAVDAQEVVIYSRLPFMIGIISMAFGFIYFINGLCILVEESTVHLSCRLYQAVATSDALVDRKTQVNLEV